RQTCSGTPSPGAGGARRLAPLESAERALAVCRCSRARRVSVRAKGCWPQRKSQRKQSRLGAVSTRVRDGENFPSAHDEHRRETSSLFARTSCPSATRSLPLFHAAPRSARIGSLASEKHVERPAAILGATSVMDLRSIPELVAKLIYSARRLVVKLD